MKKKNETEYDSRPETLEHINNVQGKCLQFGVAFAFQYYEHDKSKLEPPELEVFDIYTPKLKDVTYGSDEYRENMRQMRPAIDHHNKLNRHHPEHFKDGIKGMDLVDVVEMLCDWKAASERHADGDIYRSLEINQERQGYSDDLKQILINTAHRLGW